MPPPKKALTPAQVRRLLRFKLDWIKDPVPPFRNLLDRATLADIRQAKVNFGKEINGIIERGLGR